MTRSDDSRTARFVVYMLRAPSRAELYALYIITAAIGIGMIALASYAINSSHDNKRALCALRDDEAGRIRQEQQFLRVNPNGIPGLSAELIGQSIILQQQTVNALMSLDC